MKVAKVLTSDYSYGFKNRGSLSFSFGRVLLMALLSQALEDSLAKQEVLSAYVEKKKQKKKTFVCIPANRI